MTDAARGIANRLCRLCEKLGDEQGDSGDVNAKRTAAQIRHLAAGHVRLSLSAVQLSLGDRTGPGSRHVTGHSMDRGSEGAPTYTHAGRRRAASAEPYNRCSRTKRSWACIAGTLPCRRASGEPGEPGAQCKRNAAAIGCHRLRCVMRACLVRLFGRGGVADSSGSKGG